MKIQSSLRQKIMLSYIGYFVMAALIIGLSLFTYLELRVIEGKVETGTRVAEFFGTTLEIRRFEKNYFLYHQAGDIRENLLFVSKAMEILEQHGSDFNQLAPAQKLLEEKQQLARYRVLMETLQRMTAIPPEQTDVLEQEIRSIGKTIVTIAESMTNSERQLLKSSLDTARTFLFGYIALLSLTMIAIGWMLSRVVMRPLEQLEKCMDAVSAGKLDPIQIHSGTREIVSITHAFNHMIQELQLRQQCLARSEKLASMGTLLSGVAHELNNPLSNISSSCQILQEELETGEKAFQRELLDQIDDQTERARNIVGSLLNFARDQNFHREPLALAELVAETLRFSKGQIPAGVTLHTEIDNHIVVPADRQRLQQALLNLIKNAVEAVDGNGHITLSAGVKSASDPEFNAIEFHGKCEGSVQVVDIEVSDNGAGIPPEILPRIFDPFFTTKEVGKGSGLGLSIVHDIIEEQGGCIAVKIAPDKGTTFFIRLPLENQTVNCPQPSEQSPKQRTPS